MLQKLGDHIRACRQRADECEARLGKVADPAVNNQLEALAIQWRHLATSYEFVESLERFLLDQHRSTLPTEVEKLPGDAPKQG
jgi:hypothetical protein